MRPDSHPLGLRRKAAPVERLTIANPGLTECARMTESAWLAFQEGEAVRSRQVAFSDEGVAAPMPTITIEHLRALLTITAYAPDDARREVSEVRLIIRALASGTLALVSMDELSDALGIISTNPYDTVTTLREFITRWLSATHTTPEKK